MSTFNKSKNIYAGIWSNIMKKNFKKKQHEVEQRKTNKINHKVNELFEILTIDDLITIFL